MLFQFESNKQSIESIFNIFLIAIIVIAIGFEVYKWYYYSSNESGYLVPNTISTFENNVFNQTNPHLMPVSRNQNQGQEFTYAFWLLIRKNVDSKQHIVLARNNPNINAANPVIYLGGKDKDLRTMTVKAQTYPFKEQNPTLGKHKDRKTRHIFTEVRDLPLRRWIHVAVCGRNNAIDVFVNGKLAQHASSPQPLKTSTGPLYINQNGGFDGFMSRLYYSNAYLSKDQLYRMIQNGPAPIPDFNSLYGTSASNASGNGDLPNKWWNKQKYLHSST